MSDRIEEELCAIAADLDLDDLRSLANRTAAVHNAYVAAADGAAPTRIALHERISELEAASARLKVAARAAASLYETVLDLEEAVARLVDLVEEET